MTGSRQIAGLLGPTMIAIAITEALNLRIMASPPPPIGVVYMNGTLLFVSGLAIVRGHKDAIVPSIHSYGFGMRAAIGSDGSAEQDPAAVDVEHVDSGVQIIGDEGTAGLVIHYQ